MNNILLICEGNICRSPMAEGLLRFSAPMLVVRSAGLGALVGLPADETAVRLLAERGIDISRHRATQVSREACMDADLVLVMNDHQRKQLETLFPQVRGRVRKVGEYTGCDIPDPYRQPPSIFRDALLLIDQGLQEWTARFRQLQTNAAP
jgi:protein-tyrosine phosphatase